MKRGGTRGIVTRAIESPKWLIIGGAPRSGTTLFYNILKKNPYLALKNERNLFEQALRLGEKAAAEDYTRLLTPTQQRRVRYLGEKRPEYFEFPLERCFPSAEVSILHISRRPRDAVGSMLARTNRARHGEDDRWSPFFTAADALDAWLRAWQFAVEQAQNPRFLHLKYEDLIDKPDEALKVIEGWLSIDPQPTNTEMIEKPAAYPALAELGLQNIERLNAIDKAWSSPLREIQALHGAPTPARFGGLRRLKRRLLWWYSVGRKRV